MCLVYFVNKLLSTDEGGSLLDSITQSLVYVPWIVIKETLLWFSLRKFSVFVDLLSKAFCPQSDERSCMVLNYIWNI